MGKRIKRSAQLAAEICNRMANGQSLRQVCRAEGMPSPAMVCRWAREDAAFGEQYARARADLMEFWADQIADIADDGEADIVTRINQRGEEYEQVDQEHINRSRLRVDTRKWLMSKLAPKKYGDKIEHEHMGQVTVNIKRMADDGHD